MMKHVGPAHSGITAVIGAGHVRLKADDFLNQQELDKVIRDLQQLSREAFGPATRDPAIAAT